MSTQATDRQAGGTGGHARSRWRQAWDDPQFRVAVVVAVCILVEAVVAKNILDVRLDAVSQTAAMWIWIAYHVVGRRDRGAELAFMATAVFVTAAVLVLYAL